MSAALVVPNVTAAVLPGDRCRWGIQPGGAWLTMATGERICLACFRAEAARDAALRRERARG